MTMHTATDAILIFNINKSRYKAHKTFNYMTTTALAKHSLSMHQSKYTTTNTTLLA